jgi:ketosteroid isomerase-like protein
MTKQKQKLSQELLGLERKYWQAIKDRDAETAMRLSADPCIVAGASGTARLGREALGKMIRSSTYTLHEFSLSDPEVEIVGDDVAVVAYKVRESLTVDGKPLTLDAADSSTWVRRNGDWECLLHTESIVGDPFGRDRKHAHTH